jgi:hypothetical protein
MSLHAGAGGLAGAAHRSLSECDAWLAGCDAGCDAVDALLSLCLAPAPERQPIGSTAVLLQLGEAARRWAASARLSQLEAEADRGHGEGPGPAPAHPLSEAAYTALLQSEAVLVRLCYSLGANPSSSGAGDAEEMPEYETVSALGASEQF